MRIEGWEKALDAYINKTRTRLFRWGKLDCILFGCKWAGIATGIDPAKDSYGKYSTERGAYAHLRAVYGDVYQGLDRHFKRVEPAFRQRGDLALCKIDDSETLGIVCGNNFIFFKAIGKGVVARKSPPILAVWRVE